jgi:glycosyltransferase involved in cell wall biosynthesis
MTGGGAEHVVEHLCNTLDNKRFEVICGFFKQCGELGDALIKRGVNVVRLTKPEQGKTNYFSFLEMRKYCKENNIALIHAHDVHSLMNASLVKLTLRRIKVIYTFHYGNYSRIEKKRYYFEKIFTKIPDRLIAVGTRQAKEIAATYHLPADRIQTLYNGVQEIDDVPNCEVQSEEPKKILFGSLSTLIEQKGIPVLIDAVEILNKRYPERFEVIIAGDGNMKEAMLRLCREKQLEHVIEFAGWVRDANIDLLPKFDVFVQSSKWEAMSIVILEAMSAGKPIVATDVGENNVVIEHESSGIIVPPNEPQALAEAMEKVLLSKELREKLGCHAKRRFKDNFTVEKMTHNHEKLYDSILGRPQ